MRLIRKSVGSGFFVGRFRFSQNGLSLGYGYLLFFWPWRRRAMAAVAKRNFHASRAREAVERKRLAALGASQGAIDHCFDSSRERNSRWLRFKVWVCGDFNRLFYLQYIAGKKT